MPISQELADVYLGNPDGVYFIEAIDLAHSALASTLHYTNSSFGITGLLDNAQPEHASFLPLPFDAKLPNKNTGGNQSLELSVSNISTTLVQHIVRMTEAPQESIQLAYRVFLSTQVDPAGHHINQLVPAWRYEVSSVVVTGDAVQMSATKVNIHNRSFPRVRYTRITFPGLSR